jgi:hypothetical protein
VSQPPRGTANRPHGRPARSLPLRRNPVVIAGLLASAATVITGLLTLMGSVINTHSSSIPVPQVSCPWVVQQYQIELHNDPAMITALEYMAAVDPLARQCGIETTLRLIPQP